MNKFLRVLGAAFVLSICVITGNAIADTIITHLSARAAIDHGDFQKLADGGWHFTVCGTTLKSDGGQAMLDFVCIDCEPGAFGNAQTTCVSAWKDANNL